MISHLTQFYRTQIRYRIYIPMEHTVSWVYHGMLNCLWEYMIVLHMFYCVYIYCVCKKKDNNKTRFSGGYQIFLLEYTVNKNVSLLYKVGIFTKYTGNSCDIFLLHRSLIWVFILLNVLYIDSSMSKENIILV